MLGGRLSREDRVFTDLVDIVLLTSSGVSLSLRCRHVYLFDVDIDVIDWIRSVVEK